VLVVEAWQEVQGQGGKGEAGREGQVEKGKAGQENRQYGYKAGTPLPNIRIFPTFSYFILMHITCFLFITYLLVSLHIILLTFTRDALYETTSY